ncbi:MAG: OmpA family protein [Prevotellaceae bacterium]|jgi:outer membrane protein OmpA-like peptidoglycan-associated protein/opacity protein-like surface antigen|nr:OmpA family protein [Prevotellaceae bacterium]
MKRKLYLLVIALVVVSTTGFVSAQERRQVTERFETAGGRQISDNLVRRTTPVRQMAGQENSVLGGPILFYTLDRDKEFAHWSAGVGVGGSLFDGDIYESAKRVLPTARLDWGFNGFIERSFNPIWGLGLEYTAIPYYANTDIDHLNGFSNELDIYLSINLLNLFYKTRPQKWGIFFNIGMGMSRYNAKMTNRNNGDEIRDAYGKPMDLKGGNAWVWPFAGLLEYNFSKHFAVGLKAEYRMHDKDNFEGYVENIREGNWNDAFELLTLTLRYKPHFGKEVHVRNYSYGDPDTRELEERLALMELLVAEMALQDTCCINNTEKIAWLEAELAKKPDTVVVEKETVKTISEERIRQVFNEALHGIHFETNKADIKPVSYPILDNVVTIMKENPGYMLEIIGHTDNVGAAAFNLDLSRRRALSVRNYLIRYGVSEYRLTYEGKGLTEPIATNSTAEGRALNRRVEFIVRQDGKVVLKSE